MKLISHLTIESLKDSSLVFTKEPTKKHLEDFSSSLECQFIDLLLRSDHPISLKLFELLLSQFLRECLKDKLLLLHRLLDLFRLVLKHRGQLEPSLKLQDLQLQFLKLLSHWFSSKLKLRMLLRWVSRPLKFFHQILLLEELQQQVKLQEDFKKLLEPDSLRS